jgi:hypothetical protein
VSGKRLEVTELLGRHIHATDALSQRKFALITGSYTRAYLPSSAGTMGVLPVMHRIICDRHALSSRPYRGINSGRAGEAAPTVPVLASGCVVAGGGSRRPSPQPTSRPPFAVFSSHQPPSRLPSIVLKPHFRSPASRMLPRPPTAASGLG